MRILHTSDWHLGGKRLEDFPRLEEQQAVMHEICEIAERERLMLWWCRATCSTPSILPPRR